MGAYGDGEDGLGLDGMGWMMVVLEKAALSDVRAQRWDASACERAKR